ncbi:hypothetical protein JCM8547_002858 [Rhodosporidiobolus lusitaniae]
MQAPYTPFYCEENVYQLLSHLSTASPASPSSPSTRPRLFAAFVSNTARTSLLFHQKASRAGPEQGGYVIWDYHVIAIEVREGSEGRVVVVRDRDSMLGEEVELSEYVLETVRPDLFRAGMVDPAWQSRIRLVPAEDFLANFASDRSHMLFPPSTALDAAPLPSPSSTAPSYSAQQEKRYIQPIPLYPALQGPGARARGETHNLWTQWLDMRLSSELTDEEKDEREGLGTVLENPLDLLSWEW